MKWIFEVTMVYRWPDQMRDNSDLNKILLAENFR